MTRRKTAREKKSGSGPTLGDLGEDDVVAELLSMVESLHGPGVIVGPGDDCAVLKGGARGARLLFKTDCVVEGVHYLDTTPPSKVGWKAMARCLSDIAAMGGTPDHALVTVIMPREKTMAYVKGIYTGMKKAAARFGVSIVGGETSSSAARNQAMISVSMLGSVRAGDCVLRSGGKVNHLLYVTGRLGGSLRGKHLRFVPRLVEASWLVKQAHPSAMMDLSDGLARDLPRMAAASGCGFELERAQIPRTRGCDLQSALNDGEDYELLLAVSERRSSGLVRQWNAAFPKLELTRIGRLTREGEGDADGGGGWEHFSG